MARLGFGLELRAIIVGASLAWMAAGAVRDYQQTIFQTRHVAFQPPDRLNENLITFLHY